MGKEGEGSNEGTCIEDPGQRQGGEGRQWRVMGKKMGVTVIEQQ